MVGFVKVLSSYELFLSRKLSVFCSQEIIFFPFLCRLWTWKDIFVGCSRLFHLFDQIVYSGRKFSESVVISPQIRIGHLSFPKWHFHLYKTKNKRKSHKKHCPLWLLTNGINLPMLWKFKEMSQREIPDFHHSPKNVFHRSGCFIVVLKLTSLMFF